MIFVKSLFQFYDRRKGRIRSKNKQNFMELFWKLHNNVNKRNDKEIIDFNSFLKKYMRISILIFLNIRKKRNISNSFH